MGEYRSDCHLRYRRYYHQVSDFACFPSCPMKGSTWIDHLFYRRSDALGHVFAAIGRDWTHPGIAKLYTDIGNNGYKILYLTSRAIGQADTTREYLKSIAQGQYRMPEGPVLMSPDRLMASLHR